MLSFTQGLKCIFLWTGKTLLEVCIQNSLQELGCLDNNLASVYLSPKDVLCSITFV